MTRSRKQHIQHLANELLLATGATRPEHIDPIASAKHLGLEVTFGHLPGATARVCRNGKAARIRVSDEIVLPGRRWFSIAHELGHFLLGHVIANEGSATSWARTACDLRPRNEEREADAFAVAHLMPATMVREHCKLSPANLYAARGIAETFRMSPVASALRLVDLSSESCGAAYCEHGCVKWLVPGKLFPIRRIANGARLDRDSIAFAYFERRDLDDAPRAVPATAWLGSKGAGAATIIEHAELVPEPGWGGVLSMLWIPT